jgi:predicted dehydrogenase
MFDKVELAALEVPRARWDAALEALDPGVRAALARAVTNITAFHRAQLPAELVLDVEPGGRVVQVLGLGPHRLSKSDRPSWFFERARYGGILCDIGSHQIEQFLAFTGASEAEVLHAAVGNFANPDTPELEDFGEASLRAADGASGYFRVDWFTPDGLSTWGDGRTVILGTNGTIELRKYVDLARSKTGDHLLLVDGHGEHHLEVAGKVGFTFFGDLILDCLNRTENAMTQAHAFKAAELALNAQATARYLAPVESSAESV